MRVSTTRAVVSTSQLSSILMQLLFSFDWGHETAGPSLEVGDTHNRQIIECQSANCFRGRQNMNWIGKKKTKIFE